MVVTVLQRMFPTDGLKWLRIFAARCYA